MKRESLATPWRASFASTRVNANIRLAIDAFRRAGISLPPFAFWGVEEGQHKGSEVDEIRHCALGWDVTDFGSGDFDRIGRTLFTLRNGSLRHPQYAKSYAEKLILDPEVQRAPAHFHRSKMEEIINRSGGNIMVQLTKASSTDSWSEQEFAVQVDGETVNAKPGLTVRLKPGQSLCIPPRTIHQFWGEEGTGLTVSSEVSSLCDDESDNYFLIPSVRYPAIEEDEAREFYLCYEYPH
ncbi:MAG: D-lyxose/D-mannose family sugar isomerase [Edaphobacter sp.]